MSLEEALNRNTEALLALTAAMGKTAAAPAGAAGLDTAKASAAQTRTAAAKPPSAESATSGAQASTAATPDDKTVGAAVTAAVARSGREAVVALLGEYGVAKGSALPADVRAEFIEKAKALPEEELS